MNARLDAYGGTALFLAVEQGNWLMVKWTLGTKRQEHACKIVETG